MSSLKRVVLTVLLAASVVYAVGCSSGQTVSQDPGAAQTGYDQQAQQATYTDVSAEQAKQLIDSNKDVQIIDVREDYEYAEGHIPGSKLIPIGQFTSRIGEIDRTKPVLVYCAVGSRSTSAAQVLAQSGYTQVYNMPNGIAQWPYEIER